MGNWLLLLFRGQLSQFQQNYIFFRQVVYIFAFSFPLSARFSKKKPAFPDRFFVFPQKRDTIIPLQIILIFSQLHVSRPLSKGLCDTVKTPDQPSLSLPLFCPNTADCRCLFSHSSSATQLVCPSQLCRERNSSLFRQNTCATHPKQCLQLCRERQDGATGILFQDGAQRSFFGHDTAHG